MLFALAAIMASVRLRLVEIALRQPPSHRLAPGRTDPAVTFTTEGVEGRNPVAAALLGTGIIGSRAGLVTESGPSVSFGANAARNHYDPPPTGSTPIVPGKLLLVDLWAAEPAGIYADQTWMASIGAGCGALEDRAGRTRCRARRAH